MECNRDEAIRAKTIAEGKLAEKDFAGAKKFALKAQTLYPGLDGLPQMFTTLDVYIAAENKISGEVDWYGILGVNPSADDETIKKQYRKLALVLHPDKNKCVGADGAFKLLSEAWSLLSDKAKRLQYNQRRSSKGLNLKIPTQNVRPSAPPNGYHKFTSRAPSKPVTQKNTAPPPTPPPSFRRTDTFWTICHQCKMHYEYLKIYLNSTLLCPNCHKAFLASEMAPPTNLSKPSNPSHQRHQTKTNHVPGSNSFDPGRNAAANQKPQQGGSAGANSSKQANTQWGPFSRMHGSGSKETIAAKAANVIQQASEKLKREREESQAAAGPGKKRRGLDDDGHVYGGRVPYQMAAGNGGASTGSVSGLQKPGFETDRGYGSSGLNSKPNSTRELTQLELRNMLMKKAQIEIRQKLNEWSTLAESKRALTEKVKAKESKGEKGKNTTGHDGNGESLATKRADQADNTSPSTNETDKKEHEPVSMNVPDPDFHDFDLDRTEASFQDNQVWAAYDNDDGMPRFYAIIHKVMTRKPFKMRISWLNSKATSEFSPLEWVSSGFYKTCGEFNVGKHEINKSLNSFSHPVKWTKAPRGRVHICPKMGDVWALYRNWSPDWNAFTPDDKIHKYDMVTVLNDYTEEKGVTVTPLVKVAGFKTVFHPHLDPKKVKRIPNEEMFRFSHQVPSYLLTGEEARNAPKGCLELDPAATPLELLQVITEANEVPVEEKEGKVEEKKGQNRPTIEEEEMGENGKEPAAKAEAADC